MTDDVITEISQPAAPGVFPGGQTQESLERDAQALRLHAMGYSYREISDQLKYGGHSNVSRAIQRAERRILKTPVMEHVAVELAKLDAISLRVIGILGRRHMATSGGKIVRDDDGTPLVDSAIELRALDQLLKVMESKRRLIGLDVPAKLSIDFGESEVDAAIARLVETMESRGRALEQRAARGDV